jgi:hypothetical protein
VLNCVLVGLACHLNSTVLIVLGFLSDERGRRCALWCDVNMLLAIPPFYAQARQTNRSLSPNTQRFVTARRVVVQTIEQTEPTATSTSSRGAAAVPPRVIYKFS